ncbi:hypothetical protein [Eubacterium sp. 14-2]|uniref:hypothetical protein n=1 Tax=Eubacterium sp. 14-2 TaxID=1235790 RepID=UPI0012DE0960|nr:hypothetical protein [Eubacterium sp. 14-2]
MKKRNIKCSECEYREYLNVFDSYTCRNPECKDVPIFKGKTHPHCCPIVGGKKYFSHGNHKEVVEVRFPLRG